MDYPKSVPNIGLVDGKFIDENTATGQVGSLIPCAWGNSVTDEILNVISGAGLVPSEPIHNQLLAAIQLLMRGSVVNQGFTAFTTAGVAPAFTLTPVPAITTYDANQRFRVKFNAAAPASGTLNVSGLGAKSLKRYDYTGAKIPAIIAAGQLADVEYDGVDMVLLNPLTDRDGFSLSSGVNGWLRLPKSLGSYLIQWGIASSNIAGIQAISLPTSHADLNYVVFPQSRDFAQNVMFGAQPSALGAFNVTARTSAGLTGTTFHFFTWGL